MAGIKGTVDWVGYGVGKVTDVARAGFRGLLDFIGYPVGVPNASPGAGTAFPAGVEMVLFVGQAVATGDLAGMPVVGGGVSGGGGGGYVRRRPASPRSTFVRIPAEAEPDGVRMVAAVGHAMASGGATVQPKRVPVLTASVGQPVATGIQNLTDEQWLFLLDEAA
jgi:hypothetical protein